MIQWIVCDPATGDVIESLPGLRLESSLPSYVGRGDRVSVSLPVTQRPARWQIATEPNRVILVAHHDDDPQTVLWAGPIQTVEYGSGPSIAITAISADGYAASLYTGTRLGLYSVTNRDQSLILADLLAPVAADMHGRVDVTLSGVTRSLTITDTQDKTLADAASTLMGLSGGPEYRIGWEWDATGRLVCVITVAARIGSTQPAVLLSRVEWTKTVDYSAGKGAPIVTAVATNSGAVRNQATRRNQALLDAGYLPVEYRYNPDTGVTSTLLLGQHADSKLLALQGGTIGVAITFHPDNPLILGRDFRVGDVIEVDMENPDMPEINQTMTGRMIGWVAEADRRSGEITKITPILAEA